MDLRRLIAFLIALAACLSAIGVGSRHFGVPDGLANRQTHAVMQDTAGFIWVNSISGVQRFDGRQFRSYDMPGVTRSQDYWQAGTRFGLDRTGRFRVALRTGKLFAYNPETDSFETVFDFGDHEILDRVENVVYLDHTYICSSDGLYMLDENTKKLTHISLEEYSVFDLVQPSKGIFYAATTDGVFRLTRSAVSGPLTPHRIRGIDSNRVTTLLQVDTTLYVGTFANGLYAIDLSDDSVRKVPLSNAWLPVYSLRAMPDGSIMVGQDGAGIFFIDPSDGNIRAKLDEYSSPSISANTVKDICIDNEGGLWITTTSDGITYISPETKAAWFTRTTGDSSTGICSNFVNVVFEDRDGEMWYGTDKGVSHCDTDGKWTHYLAAVNGTNTQVLSLDQAPDGRMWVGGYGMDIYCIDKNSHAVTRLSKGPDNSGLTTKYVFRVLCDGDNVWIGGILGDVVRYNTRTGTYRRFPPACVADMSTDGRGNIFIGGCDGVGFYTPQTDSVAICLQLDTIGFTHPMRTLTYDKNRSELWIASDGEGIMRYSPATGSIRRFDFNGRLCDASVNTVVCDADGRVWFFTVDEAFVIDADRQKVMNMTAVLGLGDAEFLFGTAAIRANGNICVGTTRGAFTFDPRRQFLSPKPPRIILNDLKVNHETVRPDDGNDILTLCLDRTENIELTHDRSTFAILFSLLNLEQSQHYDMRYMLEGYDGRWLQAPASGELIYKNVEPGRYRLRLQAYDSFTDSVVGERSVCIDVLRPLWLRPWAITGYVVLALLAGWYMVRRIRRRQSEKIVNSQIQSLLSLAHDLRAPISLIKAPLSEIETREKLSADGIDNLRLAKNNTDKLLDMLSRLLDLQRYGNEGTFHKAETVNMAEFLEAKAAEYRLSALHKSDTIAVENAPAACEFVCNRELLSHIVDNLLSNAVKYTSNGTIRIGGRFVANRVVINVADTGIGMSRRDMRRLFRERFRAAEAVESKEPGSGMGLLIVHRLVAMMKGNIKIESEPGKGTEVTLTFPLETPPQLPEPKTAPNEHSENAATPDNGHELILIAEDDRDLRAYLTKALSEQYDIAELDPTGDVVAQVRSQNPDIVLTDIVMPGMSGIDICKAIRNNIDTSHIPVIMLSGMASQPDIVAGLEAGANDYIVKPFDMTILRLRIRNILARMRRLQQIITAPGHNAAAAPEPEFTTDLDKEFMATVNSVIERHLDEAVYTIADFCRELGMSRTSAYNKIKRLTGESINDYINIVRLNHAKEMLATGHYTVSEVAYTVGFSDPKYFSTCFRKRFGTAPSKI